ncbi:MAG TPA: hypothetical protein DEQ73_04485 [Phycisphaerales bacterium]|nr:hypothetical protein [Phycisphaerales bacterium]
MLGNEPQSVPEQPGGGRASNCDGKDDPHRGQRYIGGWFGRHFDVKWYPSSSNQMDSEMG